MSRIERFDVVVVGGGLAGLAAGATAAAAGASVVVLERHQPGGRARTTERDGFVLNEGAHALYTGGPGMAVLRSLGLSPAGSPAPLHQYRLLAGGGLHLLPSGVGSLLRTSALGARGKVQLVRILAALPRLRPERLQGRSAAAWLADQGLRPDAEAVVRALLRLTTYVGDLDEFGADAALGQLALGSKGVLYLDGGWSQLVSGLGRLVEVRAGQAGRVVEASENDVVVRTDDSTLVARALVIASGTPAAARALLPEAPAWEGLGEVVTAACLDVCARRPPSPGYVLGVERPICGTIQGPPARQAPEGRAVVALLRYGAGTAAADRAELEAHLGVVGVEAGDVIFSRFLPRMVVAGALPRPETGGLAGRPAVTASGLPGVYLAGDWVGPDGWLADAALASGQSAARAALRRLGRAPATPAMVAGP